MKRLTIYDERKNAEMICRYEDCDTGEEYCPDIDDKCPCLQEVLDKLAEYEDTGLTPEQIKEMDRLYAEKCRQLAETKEGREKNQNETRYKPGERIWCVFNVKEMEYQKAYFMAECEDYIIAVDHIDSNCRSGFIKQLEEMEADYINGFDSGLIVIHKDFVFSTKEQAKQVLKKIE